MSKTTKEMIEVMTAYNEGKKIEIKEKDGDEWGVTYSPCWKKKNQSTDHTKTQKK